MSVSILEALMNAECNLKTNSPSFMREIGWGQLHNAVTLLDKGYSLDTEVEPLLEKHGTVESVPTFGEVAK